MKKMLSISDAAALAFHAMGLLASQSGHIFSTRELATELHASEHHLSKVLQRLTRAGYVKSLRGPSGGFSINQGWEDLSLLDIYETIEGPIRLAECLLGSPVCLFDNCILGSLLKDINSRLKDMLDGTKLPKIVDIFRHKKQFQKEA
jgi:Rrf2 family nitric oxide-sensitive transcriptional repressor